VYFPKFKNITCIHSNTLAYLRTALVKPAIVEPNLTRLPDYCQDYIQQSKWLLLFMGYHRNKTKSECW